jgi:hypothetical protein
MPTYSGYVNEVGFAKHLVDLTRKLNESVLRMKRGDKEDEQRRSG